MKSNYTRIDSNTTGCFSREMWAQVAIATPSGSAIDDENKASLCDQKADTAPHALLGQMFDDEGRSFEPTLH